MGGLEIGITGLHTAQKALDVIGNNIANAATDGYHRQSLDLRPEQDLYTNGLYIGQGVYAAGIVRHINTLLDREIVSKESELSQIDRELESLVSLESAFGELSTSALSSAIDDFYGALHKLSEEPSEVVYQSDVVSTAESMSNQFRNVSSVIADIEDQTYSEAVNTVDEINQLASQVAEFNKQIHQTLVRGEDANNMLDRRDQLIADLGRLIGITSYSREYGVMDLVVGEIPLVIGTTTIELEAGLVANGDHHDLGLSVKDKNDFSTDITGGSFGGLVNLRNSIIRDIDTKFDAVARNIIFETNKVHAQGVGQAGSFTSLIGWTMGTQELSEIDPPITNGGEIYIRYIDPSGNAVRSNAPITIDTTQTLSDVVTDINNLTFGAPPFTPLIANIAGDKLEIKMDTATYPGSTFDFLPGVLSEPTTSTFTGGPLGESEPDITVSGIYSGSSNETYTFTVSGADAVNGNAIGTGNTVLTVTDSGGSTVAIVNIGKNYVSGTEVEIDEGIKISLSSLGTEVGWVQNGQVFSVEAIANSDSSNLLAACGINTFFGGTSARSISVVDTVADNLNRIAVSRTVSQTDNENILAMAMLGDQAMSDLSGLSPKDYYRGLATNIGEQINITTLDQENTYGVWKSLKQQRDDTSGVDMNDEAARMLVFERMFQGMAKYIRSVQGTLDTLMGIIS